MTVDLPPENMIVHNAGASTVLYVVVDYNCSYCRRLYSEMSLMDIEVREIPVSYLSPDSGVKAAAVLCSDDPEALSASFLTGNVGAQITTCSEGVSKVEQNTQWAQDSGIGGTPFMIRPDGQTHSGYLPADRVLAFIGQ
jgi:thiol:disulfide interchange protein DsbC